MMRAEPTGSSISQRRIRLSATLAATVRPFGEIASAEKGVPGTDARERCVPFERSQTRSEPSSSAVAASAPSLEPRLAEGREVDDARAFQRPESARVAATAECDRGRVARAARDAPARAARSPQEDLPVARAQDASVPRDGDGEDRAVVPLAG